jgi:hypothetical protein
MGEQNLLASSAETGYGKQDVLDKIHSVITLANAQEDTDEDEEDEESVQETALPSDPENE